MLHICFRIQSTLRGLYHNRPPRHQGEPYSLAMLLHISQLIIYFHVSLLNVDAFPLLQTTAVFLKAPSINNISMLPSPLQALPFLSSLFLSSLPLSMAPIYHFAILFLSCFTYISPAISSTRKLNALVQEQPLVLKYHNGALLKGNVTVNLIWYGKFTPIQRSIIVDFIHSLNTDRAPQPSTSLWWKTTEKYKGGSSNLVVRHQVLLENYSLGKTLKSVHLLALSKKVTNTLATSINVVLTAKDVAVDGFCMNRCGTHGSDLATRGTYIWVGNSETQCPGYCAWPFHQPIYGPQTPPLVAPNGDVGVDGMIINLATLLANTVTNPFKNGYFQGPAAAPVEAATACTGVFGSGSYPGYPGRVLVDKVSGASYNVHGINGRKYLVPAIWDPQTLGCKTLV